MVKSWELPLCQMTAKVHTQAKNSRNPLPNMWAGTRAPPPSVIHLPPENSALNPRPNPNSVLNNLEPSKAY